MGRVMDDLRDATVRRKMATVFHPAQELHDLSAIIRRGLPRPQHDVRLQCTPPALGPLPYAPAFKKMALVRLALSRSREPAVKLGTAFEVMRKANVGVDMSRRLTRVAYFNPITIESGPTSGSTRVFEHPTSRIQA